MLDDPNPPLAGARRHDLPRASAAPAAQTAPAGGQPALADRIDRHLADCRRFQRQMAVLSLTVDSVSTIDGQAAPDLEQAVVLEFGRRLRSRVRATDQVLWVGGREFGAILLDTGHGGGRVAQARLSAALGGLYRLGPELLVVTLCIGGACYPAAGNSGLALLAAASDARCAGG